MTNFSPREIVSELDRYIVGQAPAKRAVAIALRNRWRRKQVPENLRAEITQQASAPACCGTADVEGLAAGAHQRTQQPRLSRDRDFVSINMA